MLEIRCGALWLPRSEWATRSEPGSRRDRHLQSIDDQAAVDPFGNRPANNPPPVQDLHRRQGPPALSRRDEGDIGRPGPVGHPRLELPVHQVRGHGAIVVRVGGAPEPPSRLRGDAVPTHQPGYRVDAAGFAPGDQLDMDPRAAVAGLDLAVDRLGPGNQGATSLMTVARRSTSPIVEAAGGDVQHLAQQPDRPTLALGLDELIPHDNSLAKKAVAYLKISRSARCRWFSSRSRRSSSSTGGQVPLAGERLIPLGGQGPLPIPQQALAQVEFAGDLGEALAPFGHPPDGLGLELGSECPSTRCHLGLRQNKALYQRADRLPGSKSIVAPAPTALAAGPRLQGGFLAGPPADQQQAGQARVKGADGFGMGSVMMGGIMGRMAIAQDFEGNAVPVTSVRQVGSKTFYFRQSRWIDSSVTAEAKKDARVLSQFSTPISTFLDAFPPSRTSASASPSWSSSPSKAPSTGSSPRRPRGRTDRCHAPNRP